jgi:nicotinate-nucleotide adenylyltransferase
VNDLPAPVGILGGTFDPIHNGHMRLALEAREALGMAEVRLIPNAQPPHRPMPVAPAAIRAALLREASAGTPGLVCDERELGRSGPSYTVDTLASLRDELGGPPLCLILGMDAFAGFLQWREPQRILELAHLVLVERPGERVALGHALANLLAERTTEEPARLRAVPAGLVFRCPVTPLEISSRDIRSRCAAGRSVRYLVPDAVWRRIENDGLYRH